MGLRAMLPTRFGGAAPAPTVSAPERQETRWRAASRMLRSLVSWNPLSSGAAADLPTHELNTMRARSRDAYRSNMIARAAITRCRTNIVGTGLMCRPSVDAEALGITPEDAERINAALARSFQRWAEDPRECDIESTLDIYGLQALALVSCLQSGDVFALTPMELRTGGVSELKVQLIEADRVCNPSDAMDSADTIQGIRYQGAQPVGCWVVDRYGDEPGIGHKVRTWTYYDYFGANTGRRRVLHVWNEKDRPGQVRGAPYLAPILEPLRQIGRYSDAELMAAVLSAMVTVFIEKDREELNGAGDAASPLDDGLGNDAGAPIALGNGAVFDLAPGEKANMVNPARPNANFDPFFVAMLKQIGAAIEMPLDELLLHYDKSYSAARAAMLAAWRMFELRRWALTREFCQPIYQLFVDEEVAAGRITLPGYADPLRRMAWTRAMWIGPARGAMDELKEAQAAKARIDAGLSNETMETAAMKGEDWAAVHQQRAREIAQRKAMGTWAEPAPRSAPPRTEEDTGAAA